MGNKKDIEYVKRILKDYKWNKARIRNLEQNILDDNDNTLRGIDYSNEVVQNSNISSLDNIIITRENELKRLKREVMDVDIILDSLDSRNNNQKRKLIEYFYIENMTYWEVMPLVNINNTNSFFDILKKTTYKLVGVLD